MFRQIDKNNDGFITRDEWRMSYKNAVSSSNVLVEADGIDPVLLSMATRIQSVRRGQQDRRELKAARAAPMLPSGSAPAAHGETLAARDHAVPLTRPAPAAPVVSEEDAVATKIQALQRGKMERNKMEGHRPAPKRE